MKIGNIKNVTICTISKGHTNSMSCLDDEVPIITNIKRKNFNDYCGKNQNLKIHSGKSKLLDKMKTEHKTYNLFPLFKLDEIGSTNEFTPNENRIATINNRYAHLLIFNRKNGEWFIHAHSIHKDPKIRLDINKELIFHNKGKSK
ncbi:MAG: hypothetical protein QW087_01675 [Methanomassiliicoccales archaeon]